MAKELNEESTQEDVAEAVEEIVSEVEAERQGDEAKPDAQITTEHASNDETPVVLDEDTTDADGTVSDSDSETTGDDDPNTDWREEAVAEASAYGFSDEDIADFQSREEFDRAMKLFDRQMDLERTKLTSEGEKTAGKTEAEGKPPEAPKTEAGRYDIQLDPDVYDDEIVNEFTRMRDHYENRLSAIEGRFQEDAAVASEERFDRTVDDIGFAELLGKTGEESNKEMERRRELYLQVDVELEVLKRLGRPVGDFKALVQRTARSLYPDEFDKKLIKNHTRRISRQSNGRQGGGATRPSDPPEDPRDVAERLYKEMQGV